MSMYLCFDSLSSRSPDSVGHAQEVWKGFVNMTGLANFATTAYHVSGQMEYISEVVHIVARGLGVGMDSIRIVSATVLHVHVV